MLLFKKRFLDAIRAGEKTQTIRLWKHRRMKEGQKSYIPGAGYIRIESVDEVRLEDLSEEDARRDGFESAEALRSVLQELYPQQLAAGHKAYRIIFQTISKEEAKGEG